MAKVLNFTWKGVVYPEAYFRIGNVAISKDSQVATYSMGVFGTQEARQEELANLLQVYNGIINGDQYARYFIKGVDPVAACWQCITVNDATLARGVFGNNNALTGLQASGQTIVFAGAQDIFEAGQP